METQTTLPQPAGPTEAPQRRPYAAPRVIVHGTVQGLTAGKTGTNADGDAGSFNPL